MGALNIKDKDVADKARKLARLKGTSITAAVEQALDESLKTAAHQAALDREARERKADEIVKRFQAGLPKNAPSPHDVLAELYDERGLPRA